MAKTHRNINPLLTGDDVLLEVEEQRREERDKVYCGEHPGHENVEVEYFDPDYILCPVSRRLISEVISKTTPADTTVMHGVRFKQRFTR